MVTLLRTVENFQNHKKSTILVFYFLWQVHLPPSSYTLWCFSKLKMEITVRWMEGKVRMVNVKGNETFHFDEKELIILLSARMTVKGLAGRNAIWKRFFLLIFISCSSKRSCYQCYHHYDYRKWIVKTISIVIISSQSEQIAVRC